MFQESSDILKSMENNSAVFALDFRNCNVPYLAVRMSRNRQQTNKGGHSEVKKVTNETYNDKEVGRSWCYHLLSVDLNLVGT